jgi:hypothetical protein
MKTIVRRFLNPKGGEGYIEFHCGGGGTICGTAEHVIAAGLPEQRFPTGLTLEEVIADKWPEITDGENLSRISNPL